MARGLKFTVLGQSFFACQRIGAEPYSIIASFHALAYSSKIQTLAAVRPSVLSRFGTIACYGG